MFSNVFFRENVGIWNFLAVAGQFGPFETLRFIVTFQTVPSRTELCSLNFDQFFRIFDFGKLWYYYNSTRRYNPPLVFRFSVFWGFLGSGTASGGFFGKFQYRTTRFCGVSCPRVPQTWYGRFFAQSLASNEEHQAYQKIPEGLSLIHI